MHVAGMFGITTGLLCGCGCWYGYIIMLLVGFKILRRFLGL